MFGSRVASGVIALVMVGLYAGVLLFFSSSSSELANNSVVVMNGFLIITAVYAVNSWRVEHRKKLDYDLAVKALRAYITLRQRRKADVSRLIRICRMQKRATFSEADRKVEMEVYVNESRKLDEALEEADGVAIECQAVWGDSFGDVHGLCFDDKKTEEDSKTLNYLMWNWMSKGKDFSSALEWIHSDGYEAKEQEMHYRCDFYARQIISFLKSKARL